MTVITTVSEIEPITRRTDAGEVALGVYQQLFDLLEQLSPGEWAAPTECTGWRVSDMIRHLLGAARANASMRENVRQQVWGVRHRGQYGGNALDAVNALQIADHGGLDGTHLLEALQATAPDAVKARMRTPAPIRAVTVPLAAGGSTATGMPRSVNLGHLADVIYTRDVWMHTVDIARATERTANLTDLINRRIICDVVAEWVGRHGHNVDLVLTGPVGGRYRTENVSGSDPIEYDAFEFCRVLSGRSTGQGLMATRVVF